MISQGNVRSGVDMPNGFDFSSSEPDSWVIESVVKAELGERPVWDDVQACLTWVDVNSGRIIRYEPAIETETVLELGISVGAVAPRRGGGYVAATGDGFRILDDSGHTVRGPYRPPGMGAGLRFNDGACDVAGRFWAGTSTLDGRKGAGALYRFDGNGVVTLVFDGVTESNGIGWSPDGTTMYYIDSGASDVSVKAFDFNVDSADVKNSRRLIVPGMNDGVPDGLVVDSEGCLWIAFWGGGAVRRYSPFGELLKTYGMPVTNPTCPCLGGYDRQTLFVTTAWEGMTDLAKRDEPLAGSLLSTRTAVKGQPSHFFD